MNGAGPLVSTDWLAAHLAEPNIRVADASWYLPQAGRNARAEYRGRAHSGRGVLRHRCAVGSEHDPAPHASRRRSRFRARIRKLGIGDSDFVVFYDGAGIYSAPRALWMMRAMGHWQAPPCSTAASPNGHAKGARSRARAARTAASARATSRRKPDPEIVRDFDSLRGNLQSQTEQVVDARSPSRFRGEEAEPRPGVRPGHIPGSINVYYADVLTPEGTMRPHPSSSASSPSATSIWIGPSSRAAARASRRRSCRSRSKSPARRRPRCTTARGPNGARAPTRRSQRDLEPWQARAKEIPVTVTYLAMEKRVIQPPPPSPLRQDRALESGEPAGPLLPLSL